MQTNSLLVVGYKTAVRDDINLLAEPDFQAPKNITDPVKIQRHIDEAREKWRSSLADLPYYAYFSELAAVLIMPGKNFSYRHFTPADSDIRHMHFLAHWFATLSAVPSVFAWDSRKFVKILGLACAEINDPLDPAIWYGSDHRDVESALVPSGFPSLYLSTALSRMINVSYGIRDFDPLSFRPGENSITDMLVALRVCVSMGLFPECFDGQGEAAFDYAISESCSNKAAVESKAKKVKKKESK